MSWTSRAVIGNGNSWGSDVDQESLNHLTSVNPYSYGSSITDSCQKLPQIHPHPIPAVFLAFSSYLVSLLESHPCFGFSFSQPSFVWKHSKAWVRSQDLHLTCNLRLGVAVLIKQWQRMLSKLKFIAPTPQFTTGLIRRLASGSVMTQGRKCSWGSPVTLN